MASRVGSIQVMESLLTKSRQLEVVTITNCVFSTDERLALGSDSHNHIEVISIFSRRLVKSKDRHNSIKITFRRIHSCYCAWNVSNTCESNLDLAPHVSHDSAITWKPLPVRLIILQMSH